MVEKLERLLVEESDEIQASPGSFGAEIQSGKVLVPTKVYEFFSQFGRPRDAGLMVATYQHYPSIKGELAKQLGWKEEEVQDAYEGFVDLVRDYVPDRYLNWNPPKRTFGARKPEN